VVQVSFFEDFSGIFAQMLFAQKCSNPKPLKEGVIIMQIWVNEQIDPAGLLYACIACCDQNHAESCHDSFLKNLTAAQKAAGWQARLRTVESWDEVPAAALKLS
jgi:hypothetical protein